MVSVMRIPKGSVAYDQALGSLEEVLSCIMDLHISFYVFREPVVVLGTVMKGGRALLERKYLVLGAGSIVVDKDYCSLPHIILEQDGWGEAEFHPSN